MSAQSEAAELAAKAIGKGALHLIKWGKKIIPATADEIKMYGPEATRVKALMSMIGSLSEDASKLGFAANKSVAENFGKALNKADLEADSKMLNAGREKLTGLARLDILDLLDRSKNPARNALRPPAKRAVSAEVVSDLITPKSYSVLTDPMNTARTFDMTVPNAPEGFTNIARSLGERGLIAAPKDIELAQRISMLLPDMQQVYLNLLGEGTDPAQLLQALRLMGQ